MGQALSSRVNGTHDNRMYRFYCRAGVALQEFKPWRPSFTFTLGANVTRQTRPLRIRASSMFRGREVSGKRHSEKIASCKFSSIPDRMLRS